MILMIEVKVPATSANMGPGFDCLGVAVDMHNIFLIEEIEEGLIIEGCDDRFKNEDNLVYVSMKRCFDKTGYKPGGLRIKIKSDIPVSRGLGSSAACIVGGVVAANELSGRILNEQQISELIAGIEGHPDNVLPAYLGGMVVSVYQGNKVIHSNVKVEEGIKFCALIPEFTLSTEKARSVLPQSIDYKDGIFNIGRTALLISALNNGEFGLIREACRDKLHQYYRAALIEDFYPIINECERLNCLGAFLSGAGPAIMAVIREDDNDFSREIQKFLNNLQSNWTAKELKIDKTGTVVKTSER